MLLALISMLMNEQYILNKVSLSRNTHKRKLYIDRLMKMLSKAPGIYFCISTNNTGSVFGNSGLW